MAAHHAHAADRDAPGDAGGGARRRHDPHRRGAGRPAARSRGPGDLDLLALRGEPDLRNWAATAIGRGALIALPEVVERGAPLVFRPWTPGAALRRGIWNIPVPDTADQIRPEILVAPVVGFDEKGFRLGYGGGYFDRTLAGMPEALALGVGCAAQCLETIHPWPHDIPMARVITEKDTS